MTLTQTFCHTVFYRDVKAHQGTAAPAAPEPLEPVDHFEPFKPFTESCGHPEKSDRSDGQIKCNSTKSIDSQNQNSSGLVTPRKSTPLSSSSADKVAGQDVVSKETPKVLGGFKGGIGCSGSKPSPASRLSVIDKKWLERCQVFGEIEADVRPGAGNQEIVVKGLDDGQIGANSQDRRAEEKAITNGKEHGSEHVQGQSAQRENGSEIDGEQSTQTATTALAEGENEQKDKPKGVKKGGRKRQREEESVPSEEGAAKKRPRNGKSKGATGDGEPGSSRAGGKKRKGKEDNGKKDGDMKMPKMVS